MPVLKTLHVLGAMAEGSSSLAGAAMTIQLVARLLLVVVFLMVAQPF